MAGTNQSFGNCLVTVPRARCISLMADDDLILFPQLSASSSIRFARFQICRVAKPGPRTVIFQPKAGSFFALVVGKYGKEESLLSHSSSQGRKPSNQQRPMKRAIAQAGLDVDLAGFAGSVRAGIRVLD